MKIKIKNKFLHLQTRLLFKRLLKEHVLTYKTHFLLALCFLVLAALSNAAIPFFLKPIFDDIFVNQDRTAFAFICTSVFIVFICRGIAAYGEAVTMTNLGQRIVADIQNRLFTHLIRADYSFFQNNATGRLISLFINDINLIRGTVSNVIISLGKDSLSLFCLLVLLYIRDPFLASTSLLLLPAVFFLLSHLNKKFRRVIDKTQDEYGALTSYLSQVFQGIRVVKAYCMESYEINRMRDQTQSIIHLTNKSARTRAISNPAIDLLAGVMVTSILIYGGVQVMNGVRTTGDFVSFITALFLAYEPLKRISNVNHNLQEGIIAVQRVFALIDTPTLIQNPTSPLDHPLFSGHLEFKGVSLTYPNGKRALSNLNFEVLPGQKVAFVGKSGSGKSSLINLLPRFYDPTEGVILIDGIPLTTYELEELRRHISLVSQEICLFNETIYHNICYGHMHANQDAIMAASQSAKAHDFIEKLEKKYETIVGENGTLLSGGQRQRIAIARALLKNSPFLLLDEATSALDSESEKHIQEALDLLMEGKTSIIVAHRLSTIIHSDVIYVLEDGNIVEKGTHKNLLEKKGVYYTLWQHQSGYLAE